MVFDSPRKDGQHKEELELAFERQIAKLYRLRTKSRSIDRKKIQRPVSHQGIRTLGIGSTIWQTQTLAKNGAFFLVPEWKKDRHRSPSYGAIDGDRLLGIS